MNALSFNRRSFDFAQDDSQLVRSRQIHQTFAICLLECSSLWMIPRGLRSRGNEGPADEDRPA